MGIGLYNSLASLDRPLDPKTGEPITYAESMLRANWRSAAENTITEGLFLGMLPVLKDGALARNAYEANASVFSRGLSQLKAPFKPSGWGAMTEGGGYAALGKQAGYVGIATTFYNVPNIMRFTSMNESLNLRQKIAATQVPIEDAVIQGNQQAPDAQPNLLSEETSEGRPNQKVQTDLTAGTPGL
jgi:hypothetical protein